MGTILLYCILGFSFVSINAGAVYDKALSTSTEAVLKEDLLFFSFRRVEPPRRPSNGAHQVLVSLALPEHNRLALILDRNRGRFVIETTVDGDTDRKFIEAKEIRPFTTIDSILVELDQSRRTTIVYINCRLIGRQKLIKSPREMTDAGAELRVYRGRNLDTSVDYKSDLLQLLSKLGCNNDIRQGVSNDEFQPDDEIYTYRRGDIPVLHEDEKASVLVKTLSELTETIRELQVEIQTQREETALLRDAIINCAACKPGRGHNYS